MSDALWCSLAVHHERTSDHWRTVRHKSVKEKDANKIGGIIALAMGSLEAVRGGSEMPLILMAV